MWLRCGSHKSDHCKCVSCPKTACASSSFLVRTSVPRPVLPTCLSEYREVEEFFRRDCVLLQNVQRLEYNHSLDVKGYALPARLQSISLPFAIRGLKNFKTKVEDFARELRHLLKPIKRYHKIMFLLYAGMLLSADAL